MYVLALDCTGGVAEWLGTGLQNRRSGFDSRPHLSPGDGGRDDAGVGDRVELGAVNRLNLRR